MFRLFAKKSFRCCGSFCACCAVHVGGPDSHAITRIGFFRVQSIQVINIAVLVLVSLADENEIRVILHKPVKNLLAVFQTLITKAGRIVTRRRDADYQLVCVCLCGLFQDVVLLR